MQRVLLATFALAIGLTGCSQQDSGTSQHGKPPVADLIAGKTIAERQCKGCHGIDGRGTGPAIPTLAGQPDAYLRGALAEYRDGRRTHAALRSVMEQLSDTDARNVAGYYAGLPPVAAAAPANIAVSSPYEIGQKAAAPCFQCHGADGNSTKPGVPTLAGQQPRYFVNAVHESLTGVRGASPMHMLVRDMRSTDLESIALYFASQTPAQRPAANFGNPAAAAQHIPLCAGCHGPLGVSEDAGTPSLAGQDPEYLVSALKAYRNARKYEPMMRVVASLSDADIDNLAAFFSVQKSKPAENGAALVHDLTQRCNRCHAPGVTGTDVAIPRLDGQDLDYLIMALRAYRDNRRQTSIMHNMVLPYSDAILESLAAYYASQPIK